MERSRGLSRREFLLAGGSALTLSLCHLRWSSAAAPSVLAEEYAYRAWEDLYRRQWTWDRVVKGTHVRANCVGTCSWDLYVKEGIVWREEQSPVFEATNGTLPDFNPRGCQKGACYSALMYAPSRLKYPLRRVGARGEGKWKRISWDEALGEIADKIIDTCVQHGSDSVVYGTTTLDIGPNTAGEMRFFSLLGATLLDPWAEVGDLPMGAVQTWGMFAVDGTADDWCNSDYLIVWLNNPVYTRIPDVHFLWEARYRGTKVVSINSDYNATSIHADLWINPRVGTDAALALGMANVIVSEGLYQAAYVKEQTDLPLLVRDDTRRFLRQSEVVTGGNDAVFYFWDLVTNRLAEAPGTHGHGQRTLGLGALDPALEGSFVVELADGARVPVHPVFEHLKRQLGSYTPKAVAAITGVHPNLTRKVAREFARARAGLISATWGSCKHYHSDLMQRAMILLVALAGHQGKPGGGFRTFAWYPLSALGPLSSPAPDPMQPFPAPARRPEVRDLEALFTRESAKLAWTPTYLWLHVHAGLGDAARPAHPGSGAPRPFESYVKESVEKGWMPVFPAVGKEPKVYVHVGSNPLRRWAAPQVILKNLWPKLELDVDVNVRMSTTALYSDIVLPAAGYYEKRGIKWAQSYAPYIVIGDKAVEPLFEAKSEWDIFALLARKVQERARSRGIDRYRDGFGAEKSFADFFDVWSAGGKLDAGKEEEVLDFLLRSSEVTRGIGWKEAASAGAVKIKDLGPYDPTNGMCSPYRPGETIHPSQWFVGDKEPWPTLTGRQQFYLDHEWYLEAGEQLPVHKDPPAMGGDHPLRLTGGHTRWSIHAVWRDEEHMLRLQRGGPVAYLSPADAGSRGLRDHDRVRVRNDVGSFELHVKISPAVQPGQVIVYHAWEPYMFPEWKGMQEPLDGAWKPLHLAGGYGQLHYRVFYAAPGHVPRGVRVEVEKV